MMVKRGKLARILSLMLILSVLMSVGAGAVSVSDFSDVKTGDWYYNAVKFAVDKSLFAGKGGGLFGPNDPMTRGMLVTVLGRRVEVVTSSYPGTEFSDVSATAYYAPYVNWAYEHGIVGGTGNGKFSPDADITRQDLVTILHRFMENPSLGEKALVQDVWSYTDYSSISGYAKDAMEWAFTNAVISGVSSTRLDPHGTASRAQVAQIFMNADELFGGGGDDGPEGAQEMFDGISAAYEGRLAELTAGGKEVSTVVVMAEMYTVAQKLEADGYITDLEQTSEGIFYNYADGTLGGLIMDLPEEDSTVTASALSADAFTDLMSTLSDADALPDADSEEVAADLLAYTNKIGNNHIFLGGYIAGGGLTKDERVALSNAFSGLKEKIEGSGRGLEVENKMTDTTVADLRTLPEYGAVILTFPLVVSRDGQANIVLNEKFDYDTYGTLRYRQDREAKKIGLFSVLSPENPKFNSLMDGAIISASGYLHEVAYFIRSNSFFGSYTKNFNNAYMHLGFQSSTAPSAGLVKTLQSKGVAAITGYDTYMRQAHDFKALDKMLDVFLGVNDRTVFDATLEVVKAGLNVHDFTTTYVIDTKGNTSQLKVRSIMQMALAPDKNDPSNTDANKDLVLWPDAPSTGGSFEALSATYYHYVHVGNYTRATLTLKNNTSDRVTCIYTTDYFGGNIRENGVWKPFVLNDSFGKPGAEFTLDGDWYATMPSIKSIIKGYGKSDGTRVDLPESEWITVDFTQIAEPK